MKDLDNVWKEKTSYGLKVLLQYARKRIILMHIIVTCKDYVCIQIGFIGDHTEHRNMVKSEHFQEADLACLSRFA